MLPWGCCMPAWLWPGVGAKCPGHLGPQGMELQEEASPSVPLPNQNAVLLSQHLIAMHAGLQGRRCNIRPSLVFCWRGRVWPSESPWCGRSIPRAKAEAGQGRHPPKISLQERLFGAARRGSASGTASLLPAPGREREGRKLAKLPEHYRDLHQLKAKATVREGQPRRCILIKISETSQSPQKPPGAGIWPWGSPGLSTTARAPQPRGWKGQQRCRAGMGRVTVPCVATLLPKTSPPSAPRALSTRR